MKNKKAFEMNFAWIFAIVVGAAIIFLAIFAAVKLIGTERKAQNAQLGSDFETILSPVETTLEVSSSFPPISFPSKTRIYNDCKTQGNFGVQEIGTSISSTIGEKWVKPNNPDRFFNKYLFSSSVIEGKKIFVFTERFDMPYKVADLIFIIGEKEKYCFVNSPIEVRNEITALGIQNINVTDSPAKCSKNSTIVCFASSGCDIDININSKSVKRIAQKTVYYDDTFGNSLLFGAILAEPAVYECQLTRLMKRSSSLALIYSSKSAFLQASDCGSSTLQALLNSYSALALSLNNSLDIRRIAGNAQMIEEENKHLACQLF
ncbi:hypothetical protein J4217_00450 [Candidatus Pacearchaeota archaeon]|nr:hypothetical protein [Candidatus Pacearchaeota archaeon]